MFVINNNRYNNTNPFIKDSDDTLANLTQWAIFIRMLSALLLRLNIEDENAHYQNVFGVMLTVVNMLRIALVVVQALVKPFKRLIRALQRKNVHDGELRGITVQQVSSKGFKKYFERLCLSDEEEAGWERIRDKNFKKSKEKGRKWLEENGNAMCEWRCRYVSEAIFFAKK